MFKRPYTKFRFYTILYGLLGIVCIVLGIASMNLGVLFFGGVFMLLALMNFYLAKKHKNDTDYIVRKMIDKAIEQHKEEKREEKKRIKDNKSAMKNRYKEFMAEVDADFSDDLYEDDDADFSDEDDIE